MEPPSGGFFLLRGCHPVPLRIKGGIEMDAYNEVEQILRDNSAYGVQETNPVPKGYHEREMQSMCFNELTKKDKIVLERLRLITDPWLPYYDVSYCHCLVNGQQTDIVGFPSEIPKRGKERYLVDICKRNGIYIKDITNSAKISTLSF